MLIKRRDSMRWLAAAGVAVSQAAQRRPVAASETPFQHGVASGDPDSGSVVLWTRLTLDGAAGPVRWALASDPELRTLVAEGEAPVAPERDHTVKVVATGLEPGATYYYRFAAGDATSPIGRTRTLPSGRLDRLGIALASCTNYPFGFFNAYDAIARDDSIDVVLHTGDYIYEYGADEWGDDVGELLGRRHDPPHEIVTLDDYRRRHAQYKSDPGSQAMHAAHPFVACWDDHEVTNNPWVDGAGNHQPETEGDWGARRDAALRAYFEWMPIRDPAPGQDPRYFWRSYVFGDLATLVTLETRHSARAKQIADPDFGTWQSRADRDRFMAQVIGDPARTMLSEEMRRHLRENLATSVARGQPWRLIGSASPMARLLIPDLLAGGIGRAEFPPDGEYLITAGQWNLPWYNDTWDGYAAAREEFYRLASEAGTRDLLLLTGDTHNFFASQLFNDAGEPMGVEVGTAGISSPGEFLDAGFDRAVARRIDELFAAGMEEVRWTDSTHCGYVRVVLSRDAADVTYVGVDTVRSRDYRPEELHKERIVRAGGSLAYA